MLAYGAQELLIEPFAGLVFGMTPGSTTKLAGLQHGGVLLGMLGVAIAASTIGGPVLGSLRLWTIGGCAASAASLGAIAASGLLGLGPDAFRAAVFALGLSNGCYAVAAIGSMMGLAGAGAVSREGTRMGLWGAAQAIAYGLGGVAAHRPRRLRAQPWRDCRSTPMRSSSPPRRRSSCSLRRSPARAPHRPAHQGLPASGQPALSAQS